MELPDDSRLTARVEVVQYLTSDGKTHIATSYDSDVQRSTLVGLLAIGLHDVIHQTELSMDDR